MARNGKVSKKLTGTARMQQQGYKPVQVWFDEGQMTAIKQAALLDARPVASWLRLVAMQAAMEAAMKNEASGSPRRNGDGEKIT